MLTGGEPTLQITPSFIVALHEAGYYVQVETNGTRPLGEKLGLLIDYLTVSPKFEFCPKAAVMARPIDELKVVFDGHNDMSLYDELDVLAYRYLQPCDVGDPKRNAEIVQEAVAYCLAHPQWRLSLQTQKIINVR